MKPIPHSLASYDKKFLSFDEADAYYQRMLRGSHWLQEALKLFGKHILVPRFVAWEGEPGLNYRYSGVDHFGIGFSPALSELKRRVESKIGQQFNFVLLNLYRDGDDYMGFHSDDEKSLGSRPQIGSLSFGATRRFVYKHREQAERIEIILEHGSLLHMHEPPGSGWQHSLPKQRRVKTPRLNVSFRCLE